MATVDNQCYVSDAFQKIGGILQLQYKAINNHTNYVVSEGLINDPQYLKKMSAGGFAVAIFKITRLKNHKN